MQVLSRCSSRTGMASGPRLCPSGLVRRKGEGTWNPSEIPNPPWLLPTEQGLDLCCPHRFVKCPTTPLTPPCRWATLVLLNKAAISQLLELEGLSGQLFWFLVWFSYFVVFLLLLWHTREIYRNIKRPESGGDGCAELTTGPWICQAGIYYSRGGDSYVKIKLKSQQ